MDIAVGLKGFDSLDTYGYIVRIRDKGDKIYLENKRRNSDGSFEEARIKVDDIKKTLNFFMNMGYEPYLVIERYRMELKYKDLKICIDEVTLLGTFVEIEYQDSDIEMVKEFITKFAITCEPQELYGDIFKKHILDKEFSNEFDNLVKRCIK